MQRQTVLVVAALVATAATAWWLWPQGPIHPEPLPVRRTPAPVAVAPPPVAPPAAPPSSPAAKGDAVQPSVPPPVAEPAAQVPPLEGGAAPAPAVEGGTSTPPPAAEVADAQPAEAPAQPEAEAEAPAEVGDTASDAGPEDASNAPSDAPEAVGGEADVPATIDEEHAIDLFAERMATLEQDADESASRDAAMQREFDARGDGGDDAATRARELRSRLQAWIAGLPPDPPHDVLLASVECRTGSCRVLLAEGGVDLSGQAETPGKAAVNALQESFLALRSADWWPSLQLGDASLSMHAADHATAPGYMLWTIYINVADA